MKQVALRLADEVVARVDSCRGGTSREQWIRDAIEEALPGGRVAAREAVRDVRGAGRSAGVGRVRGAGARASSSSGLASAVSRPAAGAPASGSSAELAGLVARAADRVRPAVPLVNVVAGRKRLPRALAARDVASGLVRVDGVVCRDVGAVVDPGEVEC